MAYILGFDGRYTKVYIPQKSMSSSIMAAHLEQSKHSHTQVIGIHIVCTLFVRVNHI